jgi:diguanylate cyclase (GGDEF)-like protein
MARAPIAGLAALACVLAATLGLVAVVAPGDDGLVLALVSVTALSAAGVLLLLHARMGRAIARLSRAAQSDALTDLLNRRGFEEAFELELERARRSEQPLSLIVGDLDRFKRVNDDLGHPAGDAALRHVAQTIRSAKRRFDSAARIGGEEFALLAVDCDEHGAYLLAERIRRDVESAEGELTVSFGVATFPLHGQAQESVLRAADQALYAAKRLGRNRTVISSAEVPSILAAAGSRRHDDAHVELGALLSLAEALDLRDSGSVTHCHRVGRFAEQTARELGLPPESIERVRLAGILHDVGRVGIPDDLVRKPGPLNDDEWALVRSHPEIGARLLETTRYEDIRAWILFHHERPDGHGYPEGCRWDEVPLEARILAVADAYEAMTSERSYRPARAPEEAAGELRREAGRQFDAQVVEALLKAV